MVKNISNLGDAAVYCDFGSEVNEKINASVIDYFHYISKLIKDKKIEGITNLTPSYNKLIISYDLRVTNFREMKDKIEKLKVGETVKIAYVDQQHVDIDVESFKTPLRIRSVRRSISEDGVTTHDAIIVNPGPDPI